MLLFLAVEPGAAFQCVHVWCARAFLSCAENNA